MRGRRAEIGDCVRFQSRWYPRVNGLYTIEEKALSFNQQGLFIQLSLVEYDPAISSNWNPETDEMPFVLPPLDVS
jgi:hypothetical protein